jgi:hypothetical protein
MLSVKEQRLREESACFEARHLCALRPLRVFDKAGQERVLLPHIRELEGTPFELCADEERFAVALMDAHGRQGLRKHNLRLYRVHQKKAAGDFLLVDLSGRLRAQGGGWVAQWDAFVLDVKMNAPLKLGGGGAGVQLRLAPKAVQAALRLCAGERLGAELAGHPALGALEARRCWTLTGDRGELLAFFKHLPHLRSVLRREPEGWEAAQERFRQLHRAAL